MLAAKDLVEDQAGFVAYMILLGLSLAVFGYDQGGWALGALTFAWGVLGFRRMAILSQPFVDKFENQNTLPAKLLRAMGLRKSQSADEIFELLSHQAVQILVLCGGAYMVWAIISTAFPVSSPLIASYEAALLDFFSALKPAGNTYPIALELGSSVKSLCFIFCLSMGGFLALSYALSKTYATLACLFLSPIAILLLIGMLFAHTAMPEVFWPSFSHMQGAGLDRSGLLINMMPQYADLYTPLLKRTLETGLIGVIMLATMLFAAMSIFCYALVCTEKLSIFPILGGAVLFGLLIQDVYVLYTPWSKALSMAAFGLLGFCIGQSLRQAHAKYWMFQAV